MSQIFEALRRAEALEASRRSGQSSDPVVERRRSDRGSSGSNIRIYGHGPGFSPFFEENPVLNANATGALLLMRSPVVAGQKLLLINEQTERVQECRVVRTSCRDSKELEVAVEFVSPQPEFWTDLEKPADEPAADKRKRPRVVLPRGMSIKWRGRGESVMSKVGTLSEGGLSIVVPEPAANGELIHLSFEVPAGEVTAQAIVRHSRHGEGMGVEFHAMSDEARGRLNQLLEKLLR